MSPQTPEQKRVQAKAPRKAVTAKSGFGATAITLASNPLGIFALFLVLTEAIATGPLIFAKFDAGERTPLVWFVVLFPFFILTTFYRLVTVHGPKLYGPNDFKDIDAYLTAQQKQVLAKSTTSEDEKPASAPVLALPAATSDDLEGARNASDDIELIPQQDWSHGQFAFALMSAVARGNTAAADKIFEAHIPKLDLNEDQNQLIKWKAFYELYKIKFGNGGSFATLKELADEAKNDSKIMGFIADALMHYKDFGQAADVFEAAEKEADSDGERIRLLGRAAVARSRAGLTLSVSASIERMRLIVKESIDCELDFLRAIINVAEVSGDALVQIGAMERMLEIDPSDTRIRFQLAYKHASLGNNDIALKRYLEIPPDERDASAWNNIGVEYENFKMSAKSIAAFQKAEKLGETLATSNVAERLLAAGFLQEAKESCERAIALGTYHVNITTTLARIQRMPDEDEKKETNLLQKTREKSDFYRAFGRGLTQAEPEVFDGIWRSSSGPTISLVLADRTILGRGQYEEKLNGLGALFAGGAPPRQIKVEIKGQLRGKAIWGTVSRADVEAPNLSLLNAAAELKDLLMVMSEDEKVLLIMEAVSSAGKSESSSGNAKFYTLERDE